MNRAVREIIVHCTATRPEWWADRSLRQKIDEVRAWHTRDRGWKDVGYHFLIDRDGRVGDGRPLDQVGAHVAGRNTGTIGIALFGGHGSASTDRFEDHFTVAQDEALRSLIAELQRRFGPVPVTGHNQYAAKACPGFHAPSWFSGAGARPAPVPPPPAAPVKPLGLLAALLSRIFAFLRNGGSK
jgi:N-acetylmuramoyl-L-alanine amidase